MVASSIEAEDLSGGKPLALTYSPGERHADAIFFTTAESLFAPDIRLGAEITPEIYTVYSDGSGVESYRCDHGNARHSARQVRFRGTSFSRRRTGLARFTSARAQGSAVSTFPPANLPEILPRPPRATGCFPGGPMPNSTFRIMRWTAGSERMEPVIVRTGCKRSPTGLDSAAARAQPPSLRFARLAECKPALPERVHVEISISRRDPFIPFASIRATATAARSCWALLRGKRRIVLRSGSRRSAVADRTAGCRRQDAEARVRIFLDAARRAARLRWVPRRPGNGARECGSDGAAEIHHAG